MRVYPLSVSSLAFGIPFLRRHGSFALSVGLSLALAGCAAEPEQTISRGVGTESLTGNVGDDFSSVGAVQIPDPGGVDVGIPAAGGSAISGLDMSAVGLSYDVSTDILSIGIATYGIGGDVDGDGDPSGTAAWLDSLGGQDVPDFGGTESFAVSLDLNSDGVLDVIAGVAAIPQGGSGDPPDLSGFSVNRFVGSPYSPSTAFGAPLAGFSGGVFGSPSPSAPHVEFTILQFSQLAAAVGIIDTDLSSFGVNAFMGSFEDAGIGEDHIPGAGKTTPICLDLDADGVTACAGDCDDLDPSVKPGNAEICNEVDDNCDGVVDEGFDQDVDGYTSCGGDCDDTKWEVNPSCPESCNGFDDNCDGDIDEGYDEDGDGVTSCDGDCDDTNASVHPGAAEQCNGRDDDCDGQTDEGLDQDNDGFAGCAGDCDDSNPFIHPGAEEICNRIDDNCNRLIDEGLDNDWDGVTSCDGDCNDSNPNVHPGAPEVCNAIDDNCNGQIDEGSDNDWDGVSACAGDCNDSDPNVYPGAPELCNGVDDNCDGQVDESVDLDGDGVSVCARDCDDSDPTVYPGAPELCNGRDDNCNGQVDEGLDGDGDGVSACAGDCDDTNPNVHPGAPELCNGRDDNCNGQVDEGLDADGDGVSACAGDCDDTNPNVHPGAPEQCNSRDDDCDGQVDEGLDADGDGVSACAGDCNDADANVHPGAPELCNTRDDDCDGQIDEGFDADNDGYSACNGDCDDSNPAVNGGAAEDCNDGLDNDCDGSTDSADSSCPGNVCVDYDLGAATDFNVFVFEDFTLSLDVQGKVAAGDEIILRGFGMGYLTTGGDVLIAGNRLDLDNGQVWGNAVYGSSANVTTSVGFVNGGTLRQDSPINFVSAETALTSLSATLAGLPVNGTTLVNPYGGITLSGMDPVLNVFTLNAADLALATDLSITAPVGSKVVVNIPGASVEAFDFGIFLNGVKEADVLYNLEDAASLEMGGIGIRGTILAPFADVVFNNGNYDGGIIANSLKGTAEGHQFPFKGPLTVCP